MDSWGMVFSVVVSVVIASFIPIYVDEVARCVFTKPMVAHVPGFASFGAHRGVHERIGGLVIGLDTGCSLGMANGF